MAVGEWAPRWGGVGAVVGATVSVGAQVRRERSQRKAQREDKAFEDRRRAYIDLMRVILLFPLGAFDPDNPPAVTQLRDYRDQAREWGTRFIPAAAEAMAVQPSGNPVITRDARTRIELFKQAVGDIVYRAGLKGGENMWFSPVSPSDAADELSRLSASQDLDNERIIGAILSQLDAQLIATHRGAGRQRPGAGSRGARRKARTTAGRKPGIG